MHKKTIDFFLKGVKMIKKSMQDALNAQITKEMFSSNLYLSMAGYFHGINLSGFAHWMRMQAQEEMTHALKFFDYLLDRGGQPILGEIAAPQIHWASPIDGFKAALAHEQSISASINTLADLAIKEGDHATNILLQWFITEQVEEESTVEEIVSRLELAGNSPGGLFFIDNELKTRTMPAEPQV
jgi:ferritin